MLVKSHVVTVLMVFWKWWCLLIRRVIFSLLWEVYSFFQVGTMRRCKPCTLTFDWVPKSSPKTAYVRALFATGTSIWSALMYCDPFFFLDSFLTHWYYYISSDLQNFISWSSTAKKFGPSILLKLLEHISNRL